MTRHRLLKRLENIKTYQTWLRVLTNIINRIEKNYPAALAELSQSSGMVGYSPFASFIWGHKNIMKAIPEFRELLNEFKLKVKIKQPLDKIEIHTIINAENYIIKRLNYILNKMDELNDMIEENRRQNAITV